MTADYSMPEGYASGRTGGIRAGQIPCWQGIFFRNYGKRLDFLDFIANCGAWAGIFLQLAGNFAHGAGIFRARRREFLVTAGNTGIQRPYLYSNIASINKNGHRR
jgi:hypothetical protein